MADQKLTYDPRISTIGIPTWQGVGPMIATYRNFGKQEHHTAGQAIRSAMGESEQLEAFGSSSMTLFDGWKQRVEKITLDSRIAQGTNSLPSDFTVNLPQYFSRHFIKQIHLSDIQFDGGELFIEKDWSRWCFDEGFCADWQNRFMGIQFVDGLLFEVWLPKSQTPITKIFFDEFDTTGNTIIVEFDDIVCTAPQFLLQQWGNFGGTIQIVGTPIAPNGLVLLNQNAVNYIESDGRLDRWKINFVDLAALGLDLTAAPLEGSPFPYGQLLVSNVPSPNALATVVSQMIQGSLPFDVSATTSAVPATASRNWQMSLVYNEQTGVATLNFSGSYQVLTYLGFPTVSSSILSFFGLNQQINLLNSKEAQTFVYQQLLQNVVFSSTQVTVNNHQPRPTLVNTGTRIPVGNPPRGCGGTTYNAACSLVESLEQAMNGTWFGKVGEPVDADPASPFSVTFVDQPTNTAVTAVIDAGRYTPAELAYQFINKVSFISASVVYAQDYVYYGIRFESRNPQAEFTIRFDTATIDPRRLGYDSIIYNGQTLYEPVFHAEPYYPNLYFGSSLLRRPTYQHYRAVIDPRTHGMRVTPVEFRPREGVVTHLNVATRQLRLRMPIAHGAAAGMRVCLTKAGNPLLQGGVYGFVIAPPALDEQNPGPFVGYTDASNMLVWRNGYFGSREPLFMVVQLGGTDPIGLAIDDTVTVSFTAPRSWGVDLMPTVAQTVYPSTFGCVPMYLSMTRPLFATLVSPERINPFPIYYVYLQVLLDGSDAGQNVGFAVKESFDHPNRTYFSIIRSIARLLVGNKRSDLTYDSFDRLNAITFNDKYHQYKRIGIRVVRPDGSLYNFHGNPFSVTLAFTLADRPAPSK